MLPRRIGVGVSWPLWQLLEVHRIPCSLEVPTAHDLSVCSCCSFEDFFHFLGLLSLSLLSPPFPASVCVAHTCLLSRSCSNPVCAPNGLLKLTIQASQQEVASKGGGSSIKQWPQGWSLDDL